MAKPVFAEPKDEPFRGGAASAAYQVEDATTADATGPSIWDHYLDDLNFAGPDMSGAVAINFYDRTQYLKDIALMKRMGLTSDRCSMSWARIIPAGVGPVNPSAVAHYRQFIGYGSRLGMIHVDLDTQKHTPKLSAKVYADIIAGKAVRDSDCDA
jgi:beta-glucosidase